MEEVFTWFQDYPGVLGFLVATLIFFVTVLLVSRKWIGFSITLLFLLFALASGFTIAHQKTLLNAISSTKTTEDRSE